MLHANKDKTFDNKNQLSNVLYNNNTFLTITIVSTLKKEKIMLLS